MFEGEVGLDLGLGVPVWPGPIHHRYCSHGDSPSVDRMMNRLD